jgi:hypothetical protein
MDVLRVDGTWGRYGEGSSNAVVVARPHVEPVDLDNDLGQVLVKLAKRQPTILGAVYSEIGMTDQDRIVLRAALAAAGGES